MTNLSILIDDNNFLKIQECLFKTKNKHFWTDIPTPHFAEIELLLDESLIIESIICDEWTFEDEIQYEIQYDLENIENIENDYDYNFYEDFADF